MHRTDGTFGNPGGLASPRRSRGAKGDADPLVSRTEEIMLANGPEGTDETSRVDRQCDWFMQHCRSGSALVRCDDFDLRSGHAYNR